MERSQILETMSGLKLFGMKAAYDEIIATAVKRQHEPQRIVGDLLAAEIAEKQARSIKYQMTTARLPLAKDLGDFAFDGIPINATLVHDLAGGGFLAHERNVVLVGGSDPASWCPSRYHPIEAERFAADRQTADGAGDEHRRFASPPHRQDRRPGSPRELPCSAEWPAGSSPGRAGAPLLRSP